MDMRRKVAVLIAFVITAVSIAGCGQGVGSQAVAADSRETGDSKEAGIESSGSSAAIPEETADPGYSDRDKAGTWEEEGAAAIIMTDSQASISNGAGVTAEGSIVTITREGTYIFSGDCKAGQIIVDAEKTTKVQLVLNGLTLSCKDSAPIYVKQADKVFLTLARESENDISDGEEYVLEEGEDEPDGAIFSKDDLTINGTGKLSITGNYKNGITGKDDVVIAGGEITIAAKEDGIKGRDSVGICGGTIDIKAGGDGIKSNNDTDEGKGWVSLDGGNIKITALEDGIQAETIFQSSDGTIEIASGGGSTNAVSKNNGQDMLGKGGMPENKERPGRRGGPNGQDQEPQELPEDVPKPVEREISGTPAETAAPISSEAQASASEEETKSQKGIKAGSALFIAGGTFAIDAADDAVHSNGNVTISGGTMELATGDDGVHADAALEINNGKITIVSSYEGLEGSTVIINDGTINLKARDDGINSAGGSDEQTEQGAFGQDRFNGGSSNIEIHGGSLTVDADGDGLDANGSLYITGGTVLIYGPSNSGNGALDYDQTAEITGGILVAAGGAGMAQNVSETSSQTALMLQFSSLQSKGTRVSIVDGEGMVLLSCAPEKEYQSLVISSPAMKQGEEYTVYTGGNVEGADSGAIIESGILVNGTKVMAATLSQAVTSMTDTGGMVSGGMGGGREKR